MSREDQDPKGRPRRTPVVVLVLVVAMIAAACARPAETSGAEAASAPETTIGAVSGSDAGETGVAAAPLHGRLLGLGDSIFDWLHEDGQEIPQVAAAALGLDDVNAAVSGALVVNPEPELAAEGLDIRAQYDRLDDTGFDWVVMNGGFNDLSNSCGCGECVEVLDGLISDDARSGELVDLIERIVADGPQVMFVGYVDFPDESGLTDCEKRLAVYNERLGRLTERVDGAWFVDGAEVVRGEMVDAFDPDLLHPSVEGARLVGDHVAAMIAEVDPRLDLLGTAGAGDDDAAEAAGPPGRIDADWIATGGLRYPLEWVEDDTAFGAGFSMYVAAWPFQQTHAGPGYQTGLPSTWLSAGSSDGAGVYSTIEGGLGWWTGTRFPIEAPKFTMGGVSADFYEWANGPGAGGGTGVDVDSQEWRWDEPEGKYGIAQLSNRVLFPPDALNLDADADGGLFGYGYHPLPIVDARTVDGPEGTIEVGDQSWTAFLSTADFQGPLAFFLPEFFTKPLVHDTEYAGRFGTSPFFDSNPSSPNHPVDVETHDVPAAQVVASDGTVYAKIPATQFPDNGTGDDSIILDSITSYGSDALGAAIAEWFEGGPAPSGAFAPDAAVVKDFEQLETRDHFGWTIIPVGLEDGSPEHLIDFAAFTDVDLTDPTTFRYRFDLDWVDRVDGQFVIPQYYRLVDDDTAPFGRIWTPVREADVPPETGLLDFVFDAAGVRGDTRPFETPTDPDSPWMSPGPSSETFRSELGDGSVVTYAWYRFVDQPAIVHAGFTDAERAAMQERVEAIHREWGPDRTYLAPPSTGELASLDPGVLVEPPPGLEIGYVPIVTRQELAG